MTYVANRVEVTIWPLLGHATSSKFCNMAPPKAKPIHFEAIGATISPMNSVGAGPDAGSGGKVRP